MTRTIKRGLSILIGSLALWACEEGEIPAAQGPPNVVLITIDTLRADHLGSYGYERPTTPRIDQLAAESLVFEDAHAPSSWTLPSLASLMTSVYPSSHGTILREQVLGDGFRSLAEQLQGNGYYTGGIVSQAFASRRFGLDRGFSYFDDKLAELSRGNELFKKTSKVLSDKAIKWLAARAAEETPRPWFLWLHYFDPHLAYVPHSGYSEQFGTEKDIDLYDGEIAWTDFHVGRVLDALRDSGFEENTVVVLTSDHGEEFGDHGGRYHRTTLYREVLHVPLIVRIPGRPPERSSRLTSLVDVAPLILGLTESDPLETTHGTSPVDAFGAIGPAPQAVFAELVQEDGTQLRASIGKIKWIIGETTTAGFDRATDPNELKPLALTAEAHEQLERITKYAASYSELRGEIREAELTPAELEQLRALGYVGRDD